MESWKQMHIAISHDRCSVKEVRKFTSLILQNLQKGNEELALFLGDMSTENVGNEEK